jgi:cytochrome bd-type quinol oxidase subunit 1
MDATALLLSRIQFAFTISFHIIFPAFTIGVGSLAYRSRGAASQDRPPGVPRAL